MPAFIPQSKPPPPPKPVVAGRRRVFVCSPLRASKDYTFEHNFELAKKLCLLATRAGVAPFAPHVFYVAIGLDDASLTERNAGIECGLRWLAICDELWAFADNYDVCSEGMKREIDMAMTQRVPIVVRYLPDIAAWKGIER